VMHPLKLKLLKVLEVKIIFLYHKLENEMKEGLSSSDPR
jgi:hypothetical protein